MNLRFLHLANIQFGTGTESIDQQKAIDALLKAIWELTTNEGEVDCVLISGDIVHSGRRAEFELAKEFCRNLLKTTKLNSSRLFIVPGNHDLFFNSQEPDFIKKIPNWINANKIDEYCEKYISSPEISEKFENFYAFANNITDGRLYNKTDDLYFSESLLINKKEKQIPINIIGLNSCLFTRHPPYSSEGYVILGNSLVEKACKKKNKDAMITIALLHHPINKNNNANKATWDLLLRKTEMIFTGHTGAMISEVNQDIQSNTVVINNGVSYTNLPYPLFQFNLTSINLENGRGLVQFYKYLPNYNIWKKDMDLFPHTTDGNFSFIFPSLAKFQDSKQEMLLDTLYVASIEIENIMGFKKLHLNMNTYKNDPSSWVMLLGDNSMGKTSFLRCLALGLCDENSTSTLLDTLPPGLIYKGDVKGYITVELIAKNQKSYQIVTTFEEFSGRINSSKKYKRKDNGKIVEINREACPSENLFICGFGAGRIHERSTSSRLNYKHSDALGSLFSYSKTMQDPELNLRRIIDAARGKSNEIDRTAEKEILTKFLQLIAKIFMFTDQEHIELTEKGIEVVYQDRRELLAVQGDGYKSTAAWVLDFLNSCMLAGRPLDPVLLTGIVIIDEIEQHLHPRWQRYIIKLLHDQFPGIQFITTTHSPLCAVGTADLEEGIYSLVRFYKNEDESIDVEIIPNLNGLKADQVLTSEAFNLPTTRNAAIAEKLTKFADLYLKQRTEEENKIFHSLREYLEVNLPEPAEDAESRLLQKKLKKFINDTEIMMATANKENNKHERNVPETTCSMDVIKNDLWKKDVKEIQSLESGCNE